MTTPKPLTVRGLRRAAKILASSDPDLARIHDRIGPPPLWDREPGFPTLVHIILEQQVSLASARACFDKLNSRLSELEPEAFLSLDDTELRAIGFSGQKGFYCRELARSLIEGSLDLDGLAHQSDDDVRTELVKIKGIGPWTAQVYLLMVLGRPDVWPMGDLALVKAVQNLKGLEALPTRDEFEALGEPWRPWRSIAARMLWHHYLNPE